MEGAGKLLAAPSKPPSQYPKPIALNSWQTAKPSVKANSVHTIQFMKPSPLFRLPMESSSRNARAGCLTIFKPLVVASCKRGKSPGKFFRENASCHGRA